MRRHVVATVKGVRVHVVIMGCGRVGSDLARRTLSLGHSVAIIDQAPAAFTRLGEDFSGQKLVGVGYDRTLLIEAGIERADAFAAVSSGDNSNIVAARVARETFGVAAVVARIYDPQRAEVYQRLGIPTVATVTWTADQILRRLFPSGSVSEWVDPSGKITLVEAALDPAWIGRTVESVEDETGTRVACITRLGSAMLPKERTLVQEGDLLYVLADRDDLPAVTAALGSPPAEES